MDNEEKNPAQETEATELPPVSPAESEPEETVPAEAVPEDLPEELREAPEDETPRPDAVESLSRKRRVAVVTYLGLLFVAAFIIVAVSLISESRKSSANAEAAASALEKATALQEENRELRRDLDDLQAQLDALLLQEEYAESEYAAMLTALQFAQAQLNEQTELALQRQEATDLLLTAVTEWRQSDWQDLRATLDTLRSRIGDLSPTAQPVYDFLVAELAAMEGH